VGATAVAVGGTVVAVGGTVVPVGGTGVAVGGMGVAVDGTGVVVGGMGVTARLATRRFRAVDILTSAEAERLWAGRATAPAMGSMDTVRHPMPMVRRRRGYEYRSACVEGTRMLNFTP
jgi:hypothetical protein